MSTPTPVLVIDLQLGGRALFIWMMPGWSDVQPAEIHEQGQGLYRLLREAGGQKNRFSQLTG